jgi:hypothetical protein
MTSRASVALIFIFQSHTTMALHRTSITSRSLCATPSLTAVVLMKLPGQPARRLKPQPVNRPRRRAHKLMPSILCLVSRPPSLLSRLWMIKGGQLQALVPFLLLPPALRILARAQYHRSSSPQASMGGRRRPSRRLIKVRDRHVRAPKYRLLTLLTQSRTTMDPLIT